MVGFFFFFFCGSEVNEDGHFVENNKARTTLARSYVQSVGFSQKIRNALDVIAS
jgi:hypothetical protein